MEGIDYFYILKVRSYRRTHSGEGVRDMTRELYYENSYIKTFEAKVVECKACDEGYAVVLDQTGFYPGGGGQPFDTGVLDGQAVMEVYEKDGVIYHKLAQPLEEGRMVSGEVDLERRIDFMVQHTGEHIVSGIIDKQYGYANVGFHLAPTYMTADFDGELNEAQLEEVERLANEAVKTQRCVETAFYDEKSIESMNYRSKKALTGRVRLVRVGEYDCCACCGTHVNAVNEVGMIKIIQAERHRGGMRLTILCGERARNYFNDSLNTLRDISAMTSAKRGEESEAIRRLQQEILQLKQERVTRNQAFYQLKASQYLYDRPLFIVEPSIAPQELKYLAEAMTPFIQQTVLLIVPKQDSLHYMVMSQDEDVRPFVKALNQTFNGKGGGKPHLCQGSLEAKVEEVEAYFDKAYPSWVKEIEQYEPYDAQEVQDKKVILDYINHYDNTLLRDNEVAHLTSSGWIVNKDRTKVLMAYHNIYDTWAWTGGHSDGDGNHLNVAIKEAIEETGVTEVTPISTEIFSLDVLPVEAHIKRGKNIASHLHLSVAYLLEADEAEALTIKPDENSGVKWVPVEEINAHTSKEPKMQELYAKFMDKVRKY